MPHLLERFWVFRGQDAGAGVTRATITSLLDGLERDGFLSRRGDKHDIRKVSVRLTATGQAVALDLFNEQSQWITSLFAGFDQQERETLSGLLRQVWRNVEIPAKDSAAASAGSLRRVLASRGSVSPILSGPASASSMPALSRPPR